MVDLKNKIGVPLSIALLVTFLCPVWIFAQQTLAIDGVIRTKEGYDIRRTSVEVILYTDAGQIFSQIFADPDGNFVIPYVSIPANYRLVIKAEGFKQWEQIIRLRMDGGRVARVYATLLPLKSNTKKEPASRSVLEYQVPKKAAREFEKGKTKYEKQKFKEAAKRFKKALEIYPEYLEAYTWLALIRRRQGNVKEAIELLTKAIELEKNYAEAYHQLGLLYSAQGKTSETIATLSKALELNPEPWRSHFQISMAYFDSGQLEEALVHCTQAIERHPDKPLPEGIIHRGNIFIQLRRLPEALEEFTSFAKEFPNHQYAEYAQRAAAAIKDRLNQ